MQPQFYMYCYPWDLEDEGLEESIGRLAGEIGVDGINVSATTSEIRELRGREIGGRRTFVSPAAAHFHPDKSLYDNHRIRPIPAAWMKARNPLERITKVAKKENIFVRASFCVNRGRALVERFPHAACINMFGDPSTYCLCPEHPDVQQYASTVIDDLFRNYPIDAVELTEFEYPSYLEVQDEYTISLEHPDFLHEAVHNWCFCPACQQGAAASGVDLPSVRAYLLGCLDAEYSINSKQIEKVHQSPEIEAFLAFRAKSVAGFLQRATRPAPNKTRIRLYPPKETADYSYHYAPSAAGGLVFCVPFHADFEQSMNALIESAGGPSRCDGIHWLETIDGGPALVTGVQDSIRAGYGGIAFDNYGTAHEQSLDWVRQAIRFARRETR